MTYKVVTWDCYSTRNLEDTLNAYALDGWTVVSVIGRDRDFVTVILSRPAQ